MISRTGNRGFSLIEVLVASVILFAGLGAVLRAYSMAVEALGSASDALSASDLLREKAVLAELRLMASPEPLPNQSEVASRVGVEYAWTLEARQQVLTPRLSFQTAALHTIRSKGGASHSLNCEWALFRDPP